MFSWRIVGRWQSDFSEFETLYREEIEDGAAVTSAVERYCALYNATPCARTRRSVSAPRSPSGGALTRPRSPSLPRLKLSQLLDTGHERLAEAGVVTSVGGRGDSYDNAMAESVNGLYKTELVRRRGPWCGLEDLEFATLEWVDWYNHRRLFSAIGYVPPAEYEASNSREQVLAEAGTQ